MTVAKSKTPSGTPAVPKDAPPRTDSDAPPSYQREKGKAAGDEDEA